MSTSRPRIVGEADTITARNMTQFPFLRLPGELRNKIFAFTVGGYSIVAQQTYGNSRPDTKLVCGLFTAEKTGPSGSHYERYPYDGAPLSGIFAISLVCRQMHTETSLLQYRLNYFHFDAPSDLKYFSNRLNSDQRRAITDISINYSDFSWPSDIARLRGGSYTNPLRHLLPGLRKVWIGPYTLNSSDPVSGLLLPPSKQTEQQKLIRKVVKLGLRGQECIGLRLGVFDVFDEAAIQDVTSGIVCISAGENGVKWVKAGEEKKDFAKSTQAATTKE